MRRRALGIVITAALPTAWGTSAAMAAPLPPSADPFYVAPPSLASYAPGTILRSRQVDVSLGPVPVTKLNAQGYQLLYRTNDATGDPIANVTTVIVPDGTPPAGGRQLISVDDAEDSVDSNCAPSYQLRNGEQNNGNLAAETTLAAPELALGRDLVVPDAEGPKSEYIVTGMEGRATLDSVRAVERFPTAQLGGSATPAALIGYSGGAHVTAAAGELQPDYAPELNIVGVAAGGVPVGDRETVAYLDGSVGAGVLMASAIALDRAYPQLDLNSLLNAKGKALASQVSTGCASSVFAAPFAHMDDWTTVPDAVDLPRVARIIAANALGHGYPTAPTFFYNGVHDELISIDALDKLVARYCDRGARMDYFRDPAGAEHIQGVADFYPLALNYLTGRFNGDPVPDTCAAASTNSSPSSASAVGSSPRRRGPACPAGTTIVLEPRIPRGVTVRRIVVRIGGRVVRVAHHAGQLRIDIPGAQPSRVAVDTRIIGRRRRHAWTAHRRRTVRMCAAALPHRARHSASRRRARRARGRQRRRRASGSRG